jgi:hypothetical protein
VLGPVHERTRQYERASRDPLLTSSRILSTDLCPDGPGNFSAFDGLVWISCNIAHDDGSGEEDMDAAELVGSDVAIRVLHGAASANSTISSYPKWNHTAGSGEQAFYYLANPLIAADPIHRDFLAKTTAITTQCTPITQQCLPGAKWPMNENVDNGGNTAFSCTPGFGANFTFPGVSQTIDADVSEEGENSSPDLPAVGLAFASDAQLSERIGKYDPNLAGKLKAGSNQSRPIADISYKYLQPANPLYFGAWALGYPGVNVDQTNITAASTNPLLNDSQIYRTEIGSSTQWVLSCSATVYDVSYTWVNGAVQTFNMTLASAETGGMISAPFALDRIRERSIALQAIAAAASASDNSTSLAHMFADHWSQAALALSSGVMSSEYNNVSQWRQSIQVARVPMAPLFILLALKAIYVLAVLALAIGAYCFTHPAETEIVKTQLSTRGLAAAHFDTPGILQSQVVSQLKERLQPTTTNEDHAELDDPAKGGLKRAATFLGDMPDKRIGVVAQADGLWRFAVVADGIWNGIKPLAVDLVNIEARAGNLGTPGEVVKAWIK